MLVTTVPTRFQGQLPCQLGSWPAWSHRSVWSEFWPWTRNSQMFNKKSLKKNSSHGLALFVGHYKIFLWLSQDTYSLNIFGILGVVYIKCSWTLGVQWSRQKIILTSLHLRTYKPNPTEQVGQILSNRMSPEILIPELTWNQLFRVKTVLPHRNSYA